MDSVLLRDAAALFIRDVHASERNRITKIFFEPIDRGLGQQAGRSEIGVQIDKDGLLRRLGLVDREAAVVACARSQHHIGQQRCNQLQRPRVAMQPRKPATASPAPHPKTEAQAS